jgi:hypothetical protein
MMVELGIDGWVLMADEWALLLALRSPTQLSSRTESRRNICKACGGPSLGIQLYIFENGMTSHRYMGIVVVMVENVVVASVASRSDETKKMTRLVIYYR